MTRERAVRLLAMAIATATLLFHRMSEEAMAQGRTSNTARLVRVH